MVVVLYAAAIVVMWVLAWGSLTFANVLGGLVVAAVLVVVTPGRPGPRPVDDRPSGRCRSHDSLGFALVEMARSNILLVRDVLAPRSRLHPGVMAVPLPRCSDGLLTLITNMLALTPGTNPVHVEPDPAVVYVHVLHMHDVEKSRAEVLHLADLAFRAFSPNPRAIEQMIEDELVIEATFVVLLLAFFGFAYRLVRGPTLADRVIAIDGLLVVGVSTVVVHAVDVQRGAFLQLAVLFTLVGFIGTAVVARFIEGRGE